jgi:hypothetical protein
MPLEMGCGGLIHQYLRELVDQFVGGPRVDRDSPRNAHNGAGSKAPRS